MKNEKNEKSSFFITSVRINFYKIAVMLVTYRPYGTISLRGSLFSTNSYLLAQIISGTVPLDYLRQQIAVGRKTINNQ